VNLEDLDYFLTIAQEGSVGRAAAHFNVSQSAASQRLKRLESDLGFPLFDRSPKGMRLTLAASAFFSRASLARKSLNGAIKEATDLHLGEAGVLRVGISPLHFHRRFELACQQLLQNRPAARIDISMNLNAPLVEALRQGQIELSVHALEQPTPEDLNQIPLFRNDLVVIAGCEHPLMRRDNLEFEDLCGEYWLLPGPKVGARRLVEARFAELGLPPPKVAIEVDTATIQLNHVWRREIGIVFLRECHLSPLASRFVELLMDEN
jgi:DNA-binding transcriptional LysR family regulator